MIARLESLGFSVHLTIFCKLAVYPKSKVTPEVLEWLKANREALYREVVDRDYKRFERLMRKYGNCSPRV